MIDQIMTKLLAESAASRTEAAVEFSQVRDLWEDDLDQVVAASLKMDCATLITIIPSLLRLMPAGSLITVLSFHLSTADLSAIVALLKPIGTMRDREKAAEILVSLIAKAISDDCTHMCMELLPSGECKDITGEALIDAVKKGTTKVRRSAACILVYGDYKQKAIMPLLADMAINDPAIENRRAAAAWLSHYGASCIRVLDKLLELLTDPDDIIRYSVVHAIRLIGRPASCAVGLLTDLLKDPHTGIRIIATEALANMGNLATSALDALQYLAAHPYDGTEGIMIEGIDAGVSQAAAEAIAKIANKRWNRQ